MQAVEASQREQHVGKPLRAVETMPQVRSLHPGERHCQQQWQEHRKHLAVDQSLRVSRHHRENAKQDRDIRYDQEDKSSTKEVVIEPIQPAREYRQVDAPHRPPRADISVDNVEIKFNVAGEIV